MKTIGALIFTVLVLGCSDGMSLAPLPDAGIDTEAADSEPDPLPPRDYPLPPPEPPEPPPPAPVPPPPAPIPVPPEGCPCGKEKAQTCEDGLCTVFEVCSICREPAIE